MRGFFAALLVVLGACEGPQGPAGDPGKDGTNGQDGTQGAPGQMGTPGVDGQDAISPWFTAPGVKLAVTNLAFASGKATVSFTLTDPKGAALDRSGKLTDGTVATSFVLAQLAQNGDGTPAQYTAYTTRIQTTPDGSKSAVQGAAESNGTFAVVDVTKGQYTYTFAADLSAYDANLTQTVAATTTRTMLDGTTWIDAKDLSIGPTQTPVARQVVTMGACNACHGALTGHGGHWTATTQCVLCHQPQSSDPDTGNTVDFKIMIHKIHRGSGLPSVVAGNPYHIVGYMQSDNDFSTVEFPQQVNACKVCHAQDAAQPDYWKANPSIATCTSCHDDKVFQASQVGGYKTLHTGLEQQDGSCIICHRDGSIHPVEQRHYSGVLDPAAPKLAITIDGITNTGPGQSPTVNFTVMLNGAPDNIQTAPLPRLRVTFAGPNADITSFWQATVQGSGASGTLTAIDAANGKFAYTVPAASQIPAAATGSYTVGMEGYVQDANGVRYPMMNPELAFGVTDPSPTTRRQVVALANCNTCHGTLNFHGPDGQGTRKDPQYCVLCHNANNTGNGTQRLEGSTVQAQSVDFRRLIHMIHMGEKRTNPFTWYTGVATATPAGTPEVFDVRYPRDQATCTACHAGTTYQLPMALGLAPTMDEELTCTEDPAADGDSYCTGTSWVVAKQEPVAAEAAVCTGCHDAPYTLVHAQLNTTSDGQTACAACHGPGMIEDVKVVHHLP